MDHLIGQDGQTIGVTVFFKPGDPFTERVAEQLGP